MNRKTAIIVEDEYPARLRMQQFLSAYQNELTIVGEADTGKKAIALIEAERPEVVFLDIQLPDMTGFEVLKQISYNPWVIFTTAYSEYALKAFENYSIDYLVKPIEEKRFEQAITKLGNWNRESNDSNADWKLVQKMIQEVQSPKQSSSFAIKKKDKIILVDFEDLVFFQAEDKYVTAHLKNGKEHLLSKSLSKLEEILPPQFLRVHRSYIVNRNYITEIHKYFKGKFVLQLSDGNQSQITTGETYTAVVKQAFGL